ncbi:SpoIIE family protein phosphatase [Nocardioides plantarum]|uniref:SpoIIE family protein phosphatase n=1 Tax=Nocardioides plantarum TaxID=29299 RepID=A0ABV5KFD5_9ACTN|nr:SpoIIE family protein phosphatase [Nocardioides plantarum]
MSAGLQAETVRRQAPAAVLMVDLTTRQVVHVNGVATELAPGVTLPVHLDEWSDAASLRDLDGAELSETSHPLSRVARDEPVLGQAVSAARRSALGERREPLWVVALPLVDAPVLHDHALVVLIPLVEAAIDSLPSDLAAVADDAVGLAAAGLEASDLGGDLRDRALGATALAFTVADALDPEQPLLWVNSAFTATTGYGRDEVLGRNCRFLQGPETDPVSRGHLRDAIDRGVSASITLLNYRKDGSEFWNQVDLSPVRDAEGRVAHFVGIQTDVTVRVEAELEARRALAAEQEARADAEATRTRLSFLVEAVNRLSGTLDVAECADRLLGLVVPYLADWALLVHDDLSGAPASTVKGRHRDQRRQGEVDALAAVLPRALLDGGVADVLLGESQVRIIGGLDSTDSLEERAGYLSDLSVTDLTRALGGREALLVALPGRSTNRDVLILVRTGERKAFDDTDTTTALDLGRRAGLILDNAALYQAQARIAEVLQRSLLPELQPVAGVDAAARYQANERGAEVGGDFYELLDLGEAGLAIAVGDVTGHDILAAAAMGHLKGLLRAAAHERHQRPAAVLEHVDHLMLGLGMPTLATAVFAHVAPLADGWRLTWSSAGHPPLIVRDADGSVTALDVHHNDQLLGLAETARTQHSVDLGRGATVLAYTDGLMERRGEIFDVGLGRLVDLVTSGPDDAEELCDHLIAGTADGPRDDDTALLVVRLP